LTSLQSVKNGEAPGWAYRANSSSFSKDQGWMEVPTSQGQVEWREAKIVVTVHSRSALGEQQSLPATHPWGPTWTFSGFDKPDLNRQYTEVSSMAIQGKPSFWCTSNKLSKCRNDSADVLNIKGWTIAAV